MQGPRLAVGTLILGFVLIGFLSAESEKDFEFAGEKDSYGDDEDFVGDQESSGDIEGSGVTGQPALYRAKINITSLQFTAEIEAARQARTIGSLQLTYLLQNALSKLMSQVRGTIRIRIVDYEQGSLMVVFDVDTDGMQTEDEIIAALKEALNSGRLSDYSVSPEGFKFNLIRSTVETVCPPNIGRAPSAVSSNEFNNWANLMVGNAFPCAGFITAWNYYNVYRGEARIGVFRQTTDSDFLVVKYTQLPYRETGQHRFVLQQPILVQNGDFIGVFYTKDAQGGIIANVRAEDNLVPESDLYQNYYISAYGNDFTNGATFQLSDFASTERAATFSVQAEMSYENVPAVTPVTPRKCSADEWTCRNGECVTGSYRCDGQMDCYDGSDEESCPSGRLCRDDEFQCVNNLQCVAFAFVCDNNDDCGDNSDEVNCGPRPVLINSYRDSSLSSEYQLSWTRPQAGSSEITRYDIKWRRVTVRRGESTAEGGYIIERPMSAFVSTEVGPQDDRYTITNLDAATYYQVEITASNRFGQSEPQAFIFRTANPGCDPGQFQCRDGGCIDMRRKCNNAPDCADDSDEEDCDEPTCPEGLMACPQEDGTVICTRVDVGCACREDQFQCLDGRGCISFLSLCDGKIDCSDFSDEANCECAEGEFQCVEDRKCISGDRRCDSFSHCSDGSDEANCPCPPTSFTCRNTVRQECVDNGLVCDSFDDCSDGSDEENCGCPSGQWQCRDEACVPDRFRCDGVPQCEDSSDEVGCPSPGCRADQYECRDGNCVEGRMRCDGIPQCEDSTDEDNCPCRDGMYQCLDGNCVEGDMRCDGIPQCEDSSDEIGCPTEPTSCPATDFQCSTRNRLECIDRRLQCDGTIDCSDGSDERDCPGCKRDEFECQSDGRCLPEGSRCNGFVECTDRSDELGCVCTDRQFRCGDGICIDLSRRCDTRIDCNDQSDELACPCRSGEFQCVNGNCVPESARCNGRVECSDRSDEANCPSRSRCRQGHSPCGTGHCLQNSRFCDNRRDCPDGSDEVGCRTLQCRADEYKCIPDNKCLSQDQMCDRVYDCSDQSDELNCQRCTNDEFQCESDRSCISLAGRCNGRKECSDGSDEMNCPTRPQITIAVSPRTLRIRAGAEAIFTCIASGLPANARVEWTRGAEGLPMQSAVELGKLMIPVAKPMDSGIYTCRVVGVQGDYSESARLEVVAVGPNPTPDPDGPCGRDEAVCQNGQCIRREYRCDGEEDCSDGSDEPPDCYNNVCEPNEFQCPSGQCVMKIWRCDGENDCDDGFDETNCQPKSPNAPCGYDEFQCVSGDQCIPLAYHCDQEIDCLDRSDEIGCAPPIITVPPVAEIEVELGSTFTILCEAVGVPTPLIVWRLNWGNIPRGDRVTTVSESGRGVLTISDARYEDAGAYTCEAINNRGSIFAIPDALVIVTRDLNQRSLSDILLPSSKAKIVTTNVLLIGGTKYMDLNNNTRTLVIGVSSQCPTDLILSLVGPKFFSECPKQKRKVDIAYMGNQAVDIEIVKRVVMIQVRGDTLPEPERDMIVLHLGGLPVEISRNAKHKQFVRGVTTDVPSNVTRIFEIAGRKRNKYNHEKQIIHVGISHQCIGKLELVDVSAKKVLTCSENIEDKASSDQRVKGGDIEKKKQDVIPIPRKVPKKTRKKIPVSELEKYKIYVTTPETIELSLGKKIVRKADDNAKNELIDITRTEGSRTEQETIEVSVGLRIRNNTKEINNEVTEVVIDNAVIGHTDNEQEMIAISGKGTKQKGQKEVKNSDKKITTLKPMTGSIEAEIVIKGHTPTRQGSDGNKVVTSFNSGEKTVGKGSAMPIETQYDTIEDVVSISGSSLSDGIEGHIFEIRETSRVEANDGEKYVEIGTGNACSNQMEVKLVGSTLHCNCDNHNISMEYVGDGPTDIEVSHETFMVEGADWSTHQNEDNILLYVGGIPNHLREKTSKSVVIRGVSPTRTASEEERIVEIVGRGVDVNRYQRQIVVVGISRTCYEYLFTIGVSGKTIVHCARIDSEHVRVVGQESSSKETSEEIVLKGQTDRRRHQEEHKEIVIEGIAPVGMVTNPAFTERENIDMNFDTERDNIVKGVGRGTVNTKPPYVEAPRRREEILLPERDESERYVEVTPAHTMVEAEVNHREIDVSGIKKWDRESVDTGVVIKPEHTEVKEIERLFVISGMETVDVSSGQNVQIGFKDYGCRKTNSFEIVSIDNDLQVGCGAQSEPVTIKYVGQTPTDVYFSRSVYSQGRGINTGHGISIIMGGSTVNEFEQRSVMEIIKNVSSSRTTGIRRVVSFGGISMFEHSQAVVDIGFTHGCNGRVEKFVENENVVIACRIGEVVLTGGPSGRDRQRTEIDRNSVVISGGPGQYIDNQNSNEIVIRGTSPTQTIRNNQVVISGEREETVRERQGTLETHRQQAVIVSGGSTDKNRESHTIVRGSVEENSRLVEKKINRTIIVDTITEQPAPKVERKPPVPKVGKKISRTIIVDTVTEQPVRKVERKPPVLKVEKKIRQTIIVDTVTEKPVEVTTKARIEIIKEPKEVKMFHLAGQREHVRTAETEPEIVEKDTDEPEENPLIAVETEKEVERMFIIGTKTEMNEESSPKVVADNHSTENIWGAIETNQDKGKENRLGTWEGDRRNMVSGRDVEKIFMVGVSEYVNVNKTEQSVEIGFVNNCDGDYNVISMNRFLRVQCKLAGVNGLLMELYSEENTEIEVSTSVRLEKKDVHENNHDKIFVQLGGIQKYIDDKNKKISVLNVKNANDTGDEIIFVDGLTESSEDSHIKVVEIGIKHICNSGKIDKYFDEEGTTVYCQRRADILPNEVEYEDDFDTASTDFRKVENPTGIDKVGLVGVMDMVEKTKGHSQHVGTFVEATPDKRKQFGLTVTSERVDGPDNAVLAPVIDTGKLYRENNMLQRHETGRRAGTNSNALSGLAVSETTEHDRRGDINIEAEYEREYSDEARTNLHTNVRSKQEQHIGNPEDLVHYSDIKNDGTRQFDVHLNQSLEIDVGNNCKGKIEAVEVDGGVMVKCTVANETFQLNLVGYGKLETGTGEVDGILNVQNDKPVKPNVLYHGKDSFITEREITLIGKGGKSRSIQEVYFASPKRLIGHPDHLQLSSHGAGFQRDGEAANEVMQGDDPHARFVEYPERNGPRRGDIDMFVFPEKRRRKRRAIANSPDAQVGPCSPPFFNSIADRQDECMRCFCFGQTVQCFSSDLQVSRIALTNTMEFVRRETDETITPVDQSYVNFRRRTGEYEVLDLTRALPQGRYYWKFPTEFLGERLTSYGGELKYTIFYEISGRQQRTTNDVDVIIKGNGIKLYYRSSIQPTPGVQTSISVPLIESAWERSESTRRRGDTEVDSQYADRTDLMMVLENLEYILVRGSYDRQQTTSRIGGVFLSTAVDYPTEYGQAYLVEECTCPTGYSGRSCQDCQPGFTRVQTGGYLGQCMACNCHGHSNDCDPFTGQCLNCLHNTYGPNCQLCRDGYYGDARQGTPNDCQQCPCPLTDPANQFSRTCFLHTDGEVTCGNCPLGYEGRRCQRCSDGYVGDPMTLGSSCTKTPVDRYCDPRGSSSEQPNPLTGRCDCRENVAGDRCDRCNANTFYLSRNYELGCVRCFCMGVSATCQSTSWNRAQLSVSFTRDAGGVQIADMNGNALDDQRLTTDANTRELRYRGASGDDTLYFSLPSRFLGDRVTAYGGSLRFTINYVSRQGEAVSPAEPLVKLSGNDIILVSRSTQVFEPNRPQSVNIMMYEQNWFRLDGQPATREHLLMALADLDSILIRASYERPQTSVSLRDVTLDIAEDRATRQDRAYAVEQCVCPVGYRGLSCEDCDTGYTRSGGGLYLGLCEPCRCNGHSSECDPETGVCRNCQHNTAGDNCDMCAVSYYGVSRGRPDDCSKCPCPLTEAPNQFSPTCEYDPQSNRRGGDVTCTACPAGHTGRRCESCIEGYTGNPLKIGDYCKVGPAINCDCDTRGTVPNVPCDENTLQCQCKPYVQGQRCARCREGHFYLEANNPQGCLTCFCSGITNQCTSSRYFRDSLRPQIGADGSHNFVLMNRRMNNIVSNGFETDSTRNQVTYNRFEGIQKERESLFFQLPAKFRGDRVTSYGGYLRFTLEYSARPEGRSYRDVDLEIISSGQALRLYNLFNPSLQEGRVQTYEILLREISFNDLRSNSAPTRETFMTILSNVEGILIRATYNDKMDSVSLRDVSMDTAVPTPNNLGGAPMVEDCRCPEGYTGLSCERCADGYLRVSDGRGGLGRCVRCNCNGHADSCDPESGRCLNCEDNTVGDRCDRCAPGYYGDATSGTPSDCRRCPCPLTTAPNQFSQSCYLAEDKQVTCDRCPTGYEGRQCERCAAGYVGDPSRQGDSCRREEVDSKPIVAVSPVRVEEPVGSSVVFQCRVTGEGPFNVVWSRLDSRRLPERASVSPRYTLTVRDLNQDDTGRYICTATNRGGVTRREVELKVISGGRPLEVRIDVTRIEVEEGQSARFVCSVVSGFNEMYILSWSRQGGQIPAKAIDQNGVLVIPNVQRSDAGNYICMGSDMTNMDEAIALLIVSESADQSPTARIEPRYQYVDEGKEVRFTCIATGIPTPRIEWYRGNNRELNPNAIITSDGVLRIPNVRRTDESDYYCKASNTLGSTEVRTLLYVTPVEKPTITIIIRQTKVIAVAGNTARLECYTEDASGRVTVFWSRASGLPAGSTQAEGLLTIPNVQPSYAGNYVCTGTDTDTGRVSTAIAVLEVKVEETSVAPTVTVEPEKLTIPMGTTGTLRCRATGVPEPTVSWIKSREELSSNHQVTGNVLRITGARIEDRGIYVCRAENQAGMDQDWSIVEVERRMRPKIDLYPNTTQKISVGSSALFQCRVMDGDPPPTITWSRAGGGVMSERIDTMENGVIMFKQAQQEDQGSYICTAENDMGTITATATLIVEGPPTIFIQPGRTVYALIGQRVTLECTADGDPTPAVRWVEPTRRNRGDVPLEGTFEVDVPATGSAVLDINSVEREDQGTYTCIAQNSGGRTEDRVQLIVREEETGRETGVAITGPSTLSVVEGQTVELICTATDIRNPIIRWRRRQGVLPPGHTVRNGVLTLVRFRNEYAGEYICSTVTQQESYEASVFIIVTVAPRLTISPQRITSRAGDTVQLRCSASGGGPYNIEWSRVGAQMNPAATERDGMLEIRQITAADAGRYRCVVQSRDGRTSEGYAIVEVEIPPSVSVRDRDVYTETGRIAVLECDVTGSPLPVVRWEKEGDQLPSQHRILNGVLTIYNVREEDAGRYMCTAQSSSGSDRDYSVLHVSTGSTIDPARVDNQVVNVGDRVSMECIVTGTPLPTITWSRQDGPLPASSILGDGILIIPSARIEDAGVYTCLATNQAGSVSSRVVLYVRAQPLINAPAAHSAALGDGATLVCDAQGYPSPSITWYRKDGEMPNDYTIVDGDLVINRVRPEDAGTYVCHAENDYGKTDTPVNLNVGDLVPHFSQDPNSYIAYAPLNDVYLDFDILLTMKPESTEGTVLYNGQYEDGGGDFVCFGLNEGYPEFRFDVGSGPAIIRGNNTLPLNEWTTVKLTRNRKKGSMVINEEPAYTGESPGYFTGLDLEGNMYLGSVPDYNNIPRVTGFREGFVGSVSEVRIKGIDLNLGGEALEIVGVEPTNTCRQNPCANGATCAPANTRYGFKCMCPQGYTGARCQEIGERCYADACGPNGRCYNLEGRSGFACICPIGKTGTGCQADVQVITPYFNRTSFVAYPAPENALFAQNLYLEFKPSSLSDGVILYEGNDKDGTGDFMSLVQKDGFLEFRFDTGSGPAVMRSRSPLRLDQWTRVTASRKNREGTLIVNDEDPVPGTSPGSTVGLNLKLPMYLGGVDPTISISPSAGASQGFIGCIAELKVNDRLVDLLTEATESLNIRDCGERRLCERRPCENDAICEDLPGPDFRCLCPATHTGKACQTEINICLTNSPCQNEAPCSITNEGYRCDCPLGFAGDNCETEIQLENRFQFLGDSFIELTKDLLPHAKTQERQTISFTIRTTESDGLIFWQGEPGGRPLNGGDYISIGVKDGYVEFSYDMGSGAAEILSRERVDDGQSHVISVERLGQMGSLTVDRGDTAYGDSQGFLQMLNANGNIYIGGVSITKAMTDSKYTQNFVGCIENINIHGKGPLEARDALSGYNVEQCRP